MLKKPYLKYIICFLTLVYLTLSTTLVNGLTPQQIPNPRLENPPSWVQDRAELLSKETKNIINQQISALEAKTTIEMTVVTVNQVSEDITEKKFATDLFNYWGVGKEKVNNGILFLVVYDNKRIEIEIGKGLSNILAPPTIENILKIEIIPLFQENNFDRGILNGVNALISRLDSSSPSQPSSPSTQSENNNNPVIGFFVILALILMAINAVFQTKKSNDNDDDNNDSWRDDNYSHRYDNINDSNDNNDNNDSRDFGGGESDGDGTGSNF